MNNGQDKKGRRGCVYFNFGTAYALHLLVSIHSLRKFYDGPITVFLVTDSRSDALKADIESLKANVVVLSKLSRSFDRHRVFLESPYDTTLALDSDMIFRGPIDELWEPLEQHGVLVTRLHAPAYGVDGTRTKPGWGNRVNLLTTVRHLLGDRLYDEALRRMVQEGIDVNVGVMGISRPGGDAFLADWAAHMERGRSGNIKLLDELLVVGLLSAHHHYLADEKWNCPADEYFRRTNLADAQVIHYFADGGTVQGIRLGRNPLTWAGRKWYECHTDAAEHLDLKLWQSVDPGYTGRIWRSVAWAKNAPARKVLKAMRRRMGLSRVKP